MSSLQKVLNNFASNDKNSGAVWIQTITHPQTPSPLRGYVKIQEGVKFLLVMPVPDQIRDDGSGIQYHNTLKRHWIPGQARNDKSAVSAVLPISTQPLRERRSFRSDTIIGMHRRWNSNGA